MVRATLTRIDWKKSASENNVVYGECEYLHNVRSLLTYPSGKTSWRAYWQLGKRGAFYPTHSIKVL